jgi:hypothetical protein
MSLLTIVQNASDQVEIAQPTSVIGNTSVDAQKFLRLANKVGRRLMKIFPWQALSKETTFTSVATEEQTSILASDFDRFISETFWNRSDAYLVSGPITAQEWQGLKATSYADTENRKFRHRGGSIYITPTMEAGKILAFEHVSNLWCQSSGGTGQSAWVADDDTGVIDEELITLGLVWEYLNAESLPNAAEAAAYEEYFEVLIENDRPSENILVAGDIFGGTRGTRHFTGVPPVSGSGGLF